MDHNNKYTKMQQNQYDKDASHWTVENRDFVVGNFDNHEAWKDYDEYLFKGIENAEDKVALDWATGPGRNIVRFNKKFKQIDGVDISQINLDNAVLWCKHNNIQNMPVLYKNNGVDLSDIPINYYDVIFSTIAMQHIAVYDIRFNYFKEFFRVLKSGGSVCIQMGYGKGHPTATDYYANFYDAPGTNSMMDVRIDNSDQLKNDLDKIGFVDFNFDIRDRVPGDGHHNAIFFRTKKP